MKQKNLLVLLVSVLALVLTLQSVSAFGTIKHVEVNGISADSGEIDISAFPGQKVPILIEFKADDFTGVVEDAKFVAWISGDRKGTIESERFDVVGNRTYAKVVYLSMPFDLDELHEARKLEIVVESEEEGVADERTIKLTIQRESYSIRLLSVNMFPEVRAGESLVIDVVLKNIGSHFAEDTFLVVSIPELQLETKSYFGDLSPLDQVDPDKEDAVERRVYLRIPSNVQSGLYTVKLKAFNSDSVVETEKRVFVTGAEKESRVIPSTNTKTFAVGEQGEYSLTLVNKGNAIQIYDLVVNAPKELEVELSDAVAVVPAGSSKNVKILVSSAEEGSHTFSVNVHAEDGTLISENAFKANVKGTERAVAITTNTTILLAVILAIVFVVLLVVLIVLLTRKPEKAEEFGESYY